MVRKIVWTQNAQKERIAIFDYWNKRTNSLKYSRKLRKEFKKCSEEIKHFPYSGIATTISKDIRLKVIGHFLMFYKIDIKCVFILSIFDSRRNPDESAIPFIL